MKGKYADFFSLAGLEFFQCGCFLIGAKPGAVGKFYANETLHLFLMQGAYCAGYAVAQTAWNLFRCKSHLIRINYGRD